jgi:hypothetical protein
MYNDRIGAMEATEVEFGLKWPRIMRNPQETAQRPKCPPRLLHCNQLQGEPFPFFLK